MSLRLAALAAGALAIACVLAQLLVPATPLYHTWQYAAALVLVLAVAIAYANGARRGADATAGNPLLIAIGGAAIVSLAGLASGLLGPDTASVIGTPDTVTPVPALGAAAFGSAGAAALAQGSAGVTLQQPAGPAIVLSRGSRRLAGESLLYLEPRPAAFIEAFDERGARLTVTQPTNASFLSPVLLFRAHQRVGAFDLPFDTFATPARHRILRALYFTPRQLETFAHANAAADTTHPAVVLTASDESGRPMGITLASSGRTASIGGVRVRVTLGTYPALAIASAPPVWALVLGSAMFVGGTLWGTLRVRRRAVRIEAQPPEPQRV